MKRTMSTQQTPSYIRNMHLTRVSRPCSYQSPPVSIEPLLRPSEDRGQSIRLSNSISVHEHEGQSQGPRSLLENVDGSLELPPPQMP